MTSSETIHGPFSIEGVPAVSWKNGGGTTRTLAVEPEGAGLDNFIWRISLAEIQSAGDFSPFPDVDRTILLWRGNGVMLRSPVWGERVLSEFWQPFNFAGEDEVSCELLGGPTSDLNLMVRRGAVVASMEILETELTLAESYDDVIVICATGRMKVRTPAGYDRVLEAGQFVRVSQSSQGVALAPEESTSFICVKVWKLPAV